MGYDPDCSVIFSLVVPKVDAAEAASTFGATMLGMYMVAGEKARLWIPAALAYGDHPVDKLVPAGDLVFDIELVGIQ